MIKMNIFISSNKIFVSHSGEFENDDEQQNDDKLFENKLHGMAGVSETLFFSLNELTFS
jgi:hypothetical protein